MSVPKPEARVIETPSPEQYLLVRPLAYVLELCGWAEAQAARHENLELLHVTFLRRAAWNGMVSFDRIHHLTGLPRYAVSRAAAKLQRRGFGKVKPDEKNKRWKRLHITLAGLKCYGRIELAIIASLMTRLREEDKVTSYYNFASHIHNAARWLPISSGVLGPWKFPDAITRGFDLNEQQKQLIGFLKELQRASEFLESRRQPPLEQCTK